MYQRSRELAWSNVAVQCWAAPSFSYDVGRLAPWTTCPHTGVRSAARPFDATASAAARWRVRVTSRPLGAAAPATCRIAFGWPCSPHDHITCAVIGSHCLAHSLPPRGRPSRRLHVQRSSQQTCLVALEATATMPLCVCSGGR